MTETPNSEKRPNSDIRPDDHDFDPALAAMRRAAVKARRRAIETTGSVPTWRDGKIVYDTEV